MSARVPFSLRRMPTALLVCCVAACSTVKVSEKTNSGPPMPDAGTPDTSATNADGASTLDASGLHPEASPSDARATSDGADAATSCTTTLGAMTCGDAGATGWCCPAQLPAIDAALVPCSYFGPAGWYGPIEPSIASCGNTRLVVLAFGYHQISCFYSASTGVLTGASEWQDMWYFCNGSSSVMSAGDVDWSCAYSYSQLACVSDGGTND